MKVILTNAEACAAVATKYNLFADEVEIQGKPQAAAPVPPALGNGISCDIVRGALIAIFDEGARVGRDGSRYKIALIKAVRTLTDCSLKEGKDFVEQTLLNEHCHF